MASLTLLLAGDVMTGRGIDQVLRQPGEPGLYESWVRDAREYVRLAEEANGAIPRAAPPAYIWGDALAAMDRIAPQLRIVNLETSVTTAGDAWPGKGIHYRMHPANVDCLAAARIDACVLANNHVLDWGHAGLLETLQVLQRSGFATAGAGSNAARAWAPAPLPLPGGGRLLVFGCATGSSGVPGDWAASARRPGVALLDGLTEAAALQLAQAIGRLRLPGDLVLVSLHWGGNWGFALPQAHRDFAHRLVDLGAADVVHGHSSHHPLPVEVYRGKLVLYGCGDLVNDYEGIAPHGSLRSDAGCLYGATLDRATGALQRLQIVPLQLRRFRLQQADAPARRWLERAFNEEGAALGTRVVTAGDLDWELRWN